MVEYGNGVSQGAGGLGGGQGGGTVDAGAAFGQFISDSVHTIGTLPPAQLALLVVIVVVGLVMLKRAF
jgi:hypothetical protein